MTPADAAYQTLILVLVGVSSVVDAVHQQPEELPDKVRKLTLLGTS
jgi:hypothetical protein